MPKSLVVAFMAGLSIISSEETDAHIGDRVIPFFELTDEALQDIDLKDGSIEDWLDVVGEPTLTSRDFFVPSWFKGAMGDNTYNPASLDYRIWLGWNQSSNHLYVAMERTDDIYINEYDRSHPTNNLMKDHDSSIEFLVDGDHSGGYFWFPTPKFCCDTEEEWKLFQNQQAQYYWAIADTPDGRHVDAFFTGLWTDWFLEPPYADGGGTTFGEAPYTSVVEFYVTPFDRLVWNRQEESQPSKLSPGKGIGFLITIHDFDIEPALADARHIVNDEPLIFDSHPADMFTDGVLVGASGTIPKDTAVQSTSWARIKSSFRSR